MRATAAAIEASPARAFEAGVVAVNCHQNYVSREHHFGENVFVTRKGESRRGGGLGISRVDGRQKASSSR